MNRRSSAIGICGTLLYFLFVLIYLITKSNWALTLWEVMTVLGAVIMYILFSQIAKQHNINDLCRTIMLSALSGTVIVTSIAHMTSIGVIRPLEARGQVIPDYFKIGYFPSVEMTLDYIAWGLFMGIAFGVLSLGVKKKPLKIISAVCSILCLAGFIGSFFQDFLWYPAPLGYGFGFLIMCIVMLPNKVQSE